MWCRPMLLDPFSGRSLSGGVPVVTLSTDDNGDVVYDETEAKRQAIKVRGCFSDAQRTTNNMCSVE